MGLVITRREGESFRVGEATVKIVSWGARRVTIHVAAPPEVPIVRIEIDDADPLPLADRLVAKIQEAERMLQAGDLRYAPILEQTRAMIRREEANT